MCSVIFATVSDRYVSMSLVITVLDNYNAKCHSTHLQCTLFGIPVVLASGWTGECIFEPSNGPLFLFDYRVSEYIINFVNYILTAVLICIEHAFM